MDVTVEAYAANSLAQGSLNIGATWAQDTLVASTYTLAINGQRLTESVDCASAPCASGDAQQLIGDQVKGENTYCGLSERARK